MCGALQRVTYDCRLIENYLRLGRRGEGRGSIIRSPHECGSDDQQSQDHESERCEPQRNFFHRDSLNEARKLAHSTPTILYERWPTSDRILMRSTPDAFLSERIR